MVYDLRQCIGGWYLCTSCKHSRSSENRISSKADRKCRGRRPSNTGVTERDADANRSGSAGTSARGDRNGASDQGRMREQRGSISFHLKSRAGTSPDRQGEEMGELCKRATYLELLAMGTCSRTVGPTYRVLVCIDVDKPRESDGKYTKRRPEEPQAGY